MTDRRRLAESLRLSGDAIGALVDQVRAAASAGLHLVQIRERDLSGRALASLVGRCLEATAGTETRVVVNDRLDVAIAVGAAGVHLRVDSIDPRRAREIAPPGFVVGRSVHDEDEAARIAEAGAVDYLIFGTVFPSRSKPDGHPLAGVERLASTARRCPVPVLAIGGVCEENLPLVARSGAAGFAAVEFFLPLTCGGAARAGGLASAVDRARRSFDTPGSVV